MNPYSNVRIRTTNPRSRAFFAFIREKGWNFSAIGKHKDYYWEYIRTLDGTELGREFVAAQEYEQHWKMKEIQNLIKHDYEQP